MPKAIALFSGPAHVLIGANEEGRPILPAESFGMPFREAFPQERFAPLLAAMDLTYVDGVTRAVQIPDGLVTTCRWQRGQDRGVGTSVHLPEPERQRELLHREFRGEPQPAR